MLGLDSEDEDEEENEEEDEENDEDASVRFYKFLLKFFQSFF